MLKWTRLLGHIVHLKFLPRENSILLNVIGMSPVTGCLPPALSNGFNLDRIYWTVGTVSVPVCTGWQERVQLVRQNLPPALPRLVAPAWTQARHATAIQVYNLLIRVGSGLSKFAGPIPDMQYIVTGSVVARFSRYFVRYPD